MTQDIVRLRANRAEERLDRLRAEMQMTLASETDVTLNPDLCIYATGSLARLEANEFSDLDAFFLLSGSSKDSSLSRIREVNVLSAVIRVAEEEGFPDFSNDGEYLKFLYLDDVVAGIGGRDDDYHNAFTARMLLMLESKFLFNEEAYRRSRQAVIESYFRDFHRHARDFKPTFLANDVLRFWRTLCLNYEHSRQWRGSASPGRTAKGHLANLKLKFSRMNICFSFLATLLAHEAPLSSDDVIADCNLTPMQRWDRLAGQFPNLHQQFATLVTLYNWFLERTGYEKTVVLNWISVRENRDSAFEKAHAFSDAVYGIVREIATQRGFLKILVI